MNSMSLQEVHDRLVAEQPSGATCPDECPFCSGQYLEEEPHMGGTNVSDKTFSEDEVQTLVDAAVAAATAPLQSELETFKTSQEAAEVETRIAEARAEIEAQVAELTTRLDAAVIEAAQAKTAHDEILSWLTAETEREQQETAAAERRDARIAQVAEVVSFPEAYVTERAAQWASLEDEAFEALLADYKELGDKTFGSGPLPHATAMTAARETGGTSKVGSAVDLIRGRNLGIDPRTVR